MNDAEEPTGPAPAEAESGPTTDEVMAAGDAIVGDDLDSLIDEDGFSMWWWPEGTQFDHWPERVTEARWAAHEAYLSRVGVASNIVSGSIFAGLLAGGIAAQHGVGGMAAIGAVGVGLNIWDGIRNRRAAHNEEQIVVDRLTKRWIPKNPVAPDLPDEVVMITYENPDDGWAALHRVRKEFPEIRKLVGFRDMHKIDSQKHSEKASTIVVALLYDWGRDVVNRSERGDLPVDDVVSPRLRARLDRYVTALSPGATPGTVFDFYLPRSDGGTSVARYEIGTELHMELIPMEVFDDIARQEHLQELLENAGRFEYQDPMSAWHALDTLRDSVVAGDESATPVYAYPAFREAFPGPTADERSTLDALHAGTITLKAALPSLRSQEARLRATPGDAQATETSMAMLNHCLSMLMEAFADNYFAEDGELTAEFGDTLDDFASKLGAGAARSGLNLSMVRPDGSPVIIRYDFYPETKDFTRTLVDPNELKAARFESMMRHLGVPAMPNIAYADSDGVWQAVDRLSAVFPEVAAMLVERVPHAAELRAAAAEDSGHPSSPGLQVLGLCVEEIVTHSDAETMLGRLDQMGAVVAVGATEGTGLTFPLGEAVIRYRFGSQGVERLVFAPPVAATAVEAPDAGGAASAPEAAGLG